MQAIALARLQHIAASRGIEYSAPPDEETEEERVVRTTISRTFAIDREAAFNTFSDPRRHVDFFDIIKGSTPLIPLDGALGPNEYIVLEHVQEENLPPRMMLVKYTLTPPEHIRKEAVTNPFDDLGPFSDRKKGLVELRFERVGPHATKLTCESTFRTNKGPVFVRGFIDHVWLRFFERLMVDTGEINPSEMLTAQ